MFVVVALVIVGVDVFEVGEFVILVVVGLLVVLVFNCCVDCWAFVVIASFVVWSFARNVVAVAENASKATVDIAFVVTSSVVCIIFVDLEVAGCPVKVLVVNNSVVDGSLVILASAFVVVVNNVVLVVDSLFGVDFR